MSALRSHRCVFCLGLVVSAIAGPTTVLASFDEFSDVRSPTNFQLSTERVRLILKGEAELELHDLQGRGGRTFDSITDTRTLGTRSPFVEIDSFWLSLRLRYGEWLAFNGILEFSPLGARTQALWADVILSGQWKHHFELGFHTPFITIDRRTERYPLIATSYWREPEIHLVYEPSVRLGDWGRLEVGVSAAFMRPLSFSSVRDSRAEGGVIRILAYGPARPFSGNGIVVGAKLELEAQGFFATGFAHLGRLSASAGTDELRNNFGALRELDGLAGDTTERDTRFFWSGARVGYHGHGVHTWLEGIASREGVLRRRGAYAQVSFEIPLGAQRDWFPTIEPIVRAELYCVLDTTRPLSNAEAVRGPAPSLSPTWDFSILTLAVTQLVYKPLVRLRVEYSLVSERNGRPSTGIPNAPIPNNELLVQLEFRF